MLRYGITTLSAAAIAVTLAPAPAAASGTQTQTFDVDPTTASSQTPDAWYKDRYAPQVFESEFFDGDDRLKLGLREAGQDGQRGAQNGGFYNYQGRKFDTPYNTVDTSVSVDLYVDSGWNDGVRAGLWATAANGNLTFPILEYATDEEVGEAGSGDRVANGFRWWQSGEGWTEIESNVDADQWYRLTIGLTGTDVDFNITNLVDNTTVFDGSVANQGASSFDNIILQGHNEGRAGEYDIYWDNVVTAVPTPMAGLAGLAAFGMLGMRRGRRDHSLAAVEA
ncbi:MAG: hypothetical protein WD294_08430 [Phycisphaeraceae bacterium]